MEQKEEVAALLKGRIIEREAAPKAEGMFASDLIKAVMGARRCGKSIFAHQMLSGKNYGYVNFDDERLVGTGAADLNHFWEAVKELNPSADYLLLDEVQNVDGWELFVNRLKRKGCNIIVTGSNSKLLSRELATHLTGRHFSIELYPFSFREFLSYEGVSAGMKEVYSTEQKAQIKRCLEEYMESGGFPEIFRLEARKNYLRELFDKIIGRDIVLRHGIRHVRALKEIALYAVSNFSSKISYNKVRNIFAIRSVHTVKNYLGFLQDAYLLYELSAFSPKLKERLTKARKIYCIDTGLMNAITTKISHDAGRTMENVVFLELKRHGHEVYYHSGVNYEVDFLVRDGLEVKRLIQVCYSLADPDTKKRELKALAKASQELGCRNLLAITWDEEGREDAGGAAVEIVPLWKWLIEN